MNDTAVGLSGVAMWSVSTVLIAYVTAIPPFQFIALVFFFGYVFVTLLQIASGQNLVKGWTQPLRSYLFWMGTAGLYTALIFIAFLNVPVFEANILNNIWPVMLIVLAALINKEKITLTHLVGGFLGFAGAIAVFLPSGGAAMFGGFQWGHALSLGSAVLWAFYSALAKNVEYPPEFFGPVFLIFSLICAAIHFSFEQTIMLSAPQWGLIAALGFCRVSYALWDYGMKHGDVILLASASYFLPLITSLFLTALGFGPLNPAVGWGAALIITGCLVVNAGHFKMLLHRKGWLK
jgi:drug/metabolite transporter (DMT)-like permease